MSAAFDVIINADDFGESEPVSRGISECIEAGVLTSTTIMANMPGSAAAME